jgi:hypothetical protein
MSLLGAIRCKSDLSGSKMSVTPRFLEGVDNVRLGFDAKSWNPHIDQLVLRKKLN